MRKYLIAVGVAGLLAAGCGGGGDDPAVDDADGATSSTTTGLPGGGGSTTITIAPGGSVDPTPSTTAPIAPDDTTPIDPATVATLPPAPDPGPSDPGFPPATPGQYSYTTTGQAAGRPVNGTQVTTVSSLGGNDIRYAATDQVLDMQYRADGVYLRQLTAKIAGFTISFQSAEGVLFIPIPQDAGRSWDWSLTDTTGQLTASWHGTTQAPETTTAGTGPFPVVDATIAINGQYDTGVLGKQPVAGTVKVHLLIDPALRLPVQLHQVTTITKPALASGLGADTTSTYTGFTPS